jgi:hypothetical protein
MPVRDLQARLREAGRIRLGTSKPRNSGPGRLPVRLSTFRLTSKDETLIRAVADLYGGEPRPWDLRPGEWEVITDADELRVVLIPVPGGSLSQWYEFWEQPTLAGGKKGAVTCTRRCDGYEQTSGDACVCPADPLERARLAKDDKACSLMTRLSVLLPDVPTMGCWRLETSGYNAGVELSAAVSLVDNALAASGLMVEARLRLEERSTSDEGQTIKFPVPALDITQRLDQVAALASGVQRGEIAPSETMALPPAPILERPAGLAVDEALSAADGLKDRESRQGRQQAPFGPPGVAPSTTPIEGERAIPSEAARAPESAAKAETTGESREPSQAVTGAETLSDAHRRQLHAKKKALGLSDEDLKAAVRELTGQDSTGGVPVARLQDLLTLLDAKAETIRAAAETIAATEGEQSAFQIPAGARARQEDQG